MKSRMKSHHIFDDMCLSLLRQGASVRFQAPGRSMHPTILDGDIITVQPVSPSDIQQGDILLYECPGGVIAHRVLRIHKRNNGIPLFILRGDAPGAGDEPVAVHQVLGRVVSVERKGHRIDPYNWWTIILRKARSFASLLKRHMSPFFQ